MADTMGTLEASRKWGYTQATIRKWCKLDLLKTQVATKKVVPGTSQKMQFVQNH